MIKKKVGVVCGGFSSEFEISIQSGNTVFKELDRDLCNAGKYGSPFSFYAGGAA